MLFNGFKQFTDGITDTKTAMWILLGGNVLNIIGNYLLIYGDVYKRQVQVRVGIVSFYSWGSY